MVVMKTIDDRTLKDFLLMDKKSFKVGVYNLYVEEAIKRGIDLAFMERMTPDMIETNNKKKIIRWGYTLALIGNIFGIAIGLYILFSKITETKINRFDAVERKTGKKIIVLSLAMIILAVLYKCLFF